MRDRHVTTVAVLLAPLSWAAGAGVPQAADAPVGADPVSLVARADVGAPARCRIPMHRGVAVVVCERRGPVPALRARGRRTRDPRNLRGVRTLVGSPLTAGETVRIRSAGSSHAQLAAVEAMGAIYDYTRYRLRPRRHRASRLIGAESEGRPSLRLIIGARRMVPVFERIVAPAESAAAPAPVPPPAPTPPPPSGPVAIRECGSTAPADAQDATDFDRLWHLERNGAGWTGGDGVFTVRLDGGHIAWLFGDSFIGGVLPGGGRSPTSPLVRNALVIQDGGCLTTAVGGPASAPTALVTPDAPDSWYWPEDARADGDVLSAVMLRVARTGPAAWDFAVVGVDVVDVDLRTFATVSRRAITPDGSVLWGSSVLDTPEGTYVYGVENTPVGGRLYLARTSSEPLDSDWLFYRGGLDPWSSDPRDAIPLPSMIDATKQEPLSGLSSAVSVFKDDDGVVLINQDPVFGTEITARRAPDPQGPFGRPELLATASPPASPGAFTYGARVQPALASRGLQLLSWNVNTFGDVMADASLYRPRFTALPWPPPSGGS